MSKVAVTVVAVFLTLIASSFARLPLNLQSNLRLPSSAVEIDRSESDDAQSIPHIASLDSSEVLTESDDAQSIPHIASLDSSDVLTESNIDGPDSSQPDLKTQPEILSIPVTFITFRPVNRHFLPFPFHHSRRHHPGFHRVMKPWIPYGDDMILGGENRGFESRPMRGGDHRMTEEWIGLDQYPRPHHHHHHHDHHEDGRPRPMFPHMHHDDTMMTGMKGWEYRVQEDAAPVKGFRKFLHQFGF